MELRMKLHEALHLIKTGKIEGFHRPESRLRYVYSPKIKCLMQIEKYTGHQRDTIHISNFKDYVDEDYIYDNVWEVSDEFI